MDCCQSAKYLLPVYNEVKYRRGEQTFKHMASASLLYFTDYQSAMNWNCKKTAFYHMIEKQLFRPLLVKFKSPAAQSNQ